jgi:hypothetical protein
MEAAGVEPALGLRPYATGDALRAQSRVRQNLARNERVTR